MSSTQVDIRPSDQVVMTIEKGERPTSPVHVHVDDHTAVHVHVKKPKKPSSMKAAEARVAEAKVKSASSFGASNLRRSTATARARSKSPSRNGPWVPPPAKTSKHPKITWQGPSHRLEISTPQEADAIQTTLRMSELDTDEEDRYGGHVRNYEHKIDSLMTEVGTLKNQVDLQRSMREVEKKEEMLEASHRALYEQEQELDDYKRELESTETENHLLRKSMDMIKEESHLTRSQRSRLADERDLLMKKLVEVEMDGEAAGKQVAALRDMIRRLKEEKRMSSSDSAMLSKQKELLMQRLTDFENTNRTLRRMLRDRHEQEATGGRLCEQRDILLRKLSETEDTCQKQRLEMLDKDRLLQDYRIQLSAQKDENVAVSGIQSSLETTRAHLQKQLRQKDADCNRMAVQIRSLESQLAQEKIDVDHLQELLGAAKEKAERDKEALKKATRVQKQRANKTEDALEQMNVQLLERENFTADLRSEADGLRARCDKLCKEKAQEQAENSALKTQCDELVVDLLEMKEVFNSLHNTNSILQSENAAFKLKLTELSSESIDLRGVLYGRLQKRGEHSPLNRSSPPRISELENIMEKLEDESKARVEVATVRLHEKTSESSALKLENERLKTSIVTIEDKLGAAEQEVSQLRGNLRQYENLVEEYRSQMNKSRREADDTIVQLEDQKQQTARASLDGEMELNKVKDRLQARLEDLEPLPELLKSTELKLQDTSEKLLTYETKSTEHTKLIAELTAKVERQNDQMDQMREKWHSVQDDNRGLSTRTETIDRKLRDTDEQNRELLSTVAKREEALHQTNIRLDEKTREVASLTRQLEAALTDTRRQTDTAREKVAARERASQARVLDLESQLSQARGELARTKREKEEAERKFNSRLYDLKDRLEQSHSTNRSMQNYVQFLKSSYANVFGDTTLSTSSPIRPSYH